MQCTEIEGDPVSRTCFRKCVNCVVLDRDWWCASCVGRRLGQSVIGHHESRNDQWLPSPLDNNCQREQQELKEIGLQIVFPTDDEKEEELTQCAGNYCHGQFISHANKSPVLEADNWFECVRGGGAVFEEEEEEEDLLAFQGVQSNEDR